MPDLTVIILTFDEERHIGRAIDSVSGVASRVIVVDSFSKDRTLDIARAKGAEVLQNPFVNQAQQFQWALDHAVVTTSWILRLDADEVIGVPLATEIAQKLDALPADVVGVTLRRRHLWMGRWLLHGGRYPVELLRIWRRGHGRVEDRWMDEHVVVSGGRTVKFDADFSDENLNDIGFFIEKHNKYATREAIEILNQRMGLFTRTIPAGTQKATARRRLRQWAKRIYAAVPFTISAPVYFLWRYIFELGFLDGRTGLIYHFLQGYWYRFLVGAKVVELQRAVAHLSDKRDVVAELSRLTGHTLQVD